MKNEDLRFRDKNGYSKYYYYQLTLCLALFLSVLIFLPYVIKNNGYFIYYGDFNAQQIPFHMHVVEMIRSGNFNWDWSTDLGANLVGDYSFYMSTSPFFWIMCLFPSSWTPYLIAPILCLKFSVAAICAYAYLKRFVKNPMFAVAGALMYAFCGAQIYNIFFNHFHDSVAFFPLMLLGIEELIQNNRRGLFAFAVFISAGVNYFFFAGQAVFCVIYFLFRASSISFDATVKKFLWLVFEAVLGVVMSLFLFLTAVLSITGNYRLDKAFSTLRGALIWQSKSVIYTKRYGHILQSLFFTPDIPSRPEFFGGTDIKDTALTHTTRWSSNAVWIPMFGMTGAITYIWNRRKSWLSRLIIFLIACSMIPVMNSLFVVGNTNYYARWMYMLALMLVVATIICLDRNEIRWTGGIITTAVCCFLILIPSFVSWKDTVDGNRLIWSTTRSSYPLRILLSAVITFGGIIAVYLLIKFVRGRKIFGKMVLAMLAFTIAVYGIMHLFVGRQHISDDSINNVIDYYINADITMKGSNSEPDAKDVANAPLDSITDEFYRIDGYNRGSNKNSLDNLGLYTNLPCIQCFNSTVPSSILNFYNDVVGSVTRDVASRPANKYYGLRAFLSVKYVFVENAGNRLTAGYEKNKMYGFTENAVSLQGEVTTKDKVSSKKIYSKNDDGSQTYYEFYVFENENFLPMGFTYTEFMRQSEFTKITKDNRHAYLCSYLVVPDDKADEYAKYLTEVKYTAIDTSANDEKLKQIFDASVDARLNGSICEDFEWSSDGFKGVIDMAEDNYVFFSVPYDVKELAGINFGGWSAKVNGEKVDIEQVYGGLMAVKAPAGENVVIEFDYSTPGRKIGAVATVAGFLVFGGYLFFFVGYKKEKASYKFFSEEYYDDLGYPAGKRDEGNIKTLLRFIQKKLTEPQQPPQENGNEE